MMPKVSIIVPVYKVEEYVHECIDSILNQTYKNIEVILVDDGSPDTCGAICDEYAKKDDRIIVIHKTNGGLSDARNVGLQRATGEYLAFVDSDDSIKKDYIEKLYNGIVNEDADVCICSVEDVFEDGLEGIRTDINYVKENTLISGIEATRFVLEDKVLVSHVWDKLCKKELYSGITFPVKKRFEDMYMMHEVLFRAKKVALITDKLYNYRHRKTSISYTNMLANLNDIFGAYLKRLDFVRENLMECESIMLYKCATMGIELYNNSIKQKNDIVDTKAIISFLKREKRKIKNLNNLPKKYRIFLQTITRFRIIHKPMYLLSSKLKGN